MRCAFSRYSELHFLPALIPLVINSFLIESFRFAIKWKYIKVWKVSTGNYVDLISYTDKRIQWYTFLQSGLRKKLLRQSIQLMIIKKTSEIKTDKVEFVEHKRNTLIWKIHECGGFLKRRESKLRKVDSKNSYYKGRLCIWFWFVQNFMSKYEGALKAFEIAFNNASYLFLSPLFASLKLFKNRRDTVVPAKWQ